MRFDDIHNLIIASPNEVWSILMKNGIELVSQVAASPVKQLSLTRPFQVRTITVPMQDGKGGVHVNTSPQMQPFYFFMQAREIPLFHDEVWHMLAATKKISDAYIQQTSGIVMPG